jgi:hypothetical protein
MVPVLPRHVTLPERKPQQQRNEGGGTAGGVCCCRLGDHQDSEAVGSADAAALVAVEEAEAHRALAARNAVAVGINRRLLLGSTVGFCWDRPSAFAVGSCWDRSSAFVGIDRKLQGELC